MKEANLARLILVAASEAGHRLWINSRGQAFRHDGTPFNYGLGPEGAADLIGYTKDGFFAAIEVKKPIRGTPVTDAQRAFIAAVTEAGGMAGIVRTVEEALVVLNG